MDELRAAQSAAEILLLGSSLLVEPTRRLLMEVFHRGLHQVDRRGRLRKLISLTQLLILQLLATVILGTP